MDKVLLTEEQLHKLVDFIASRGFRDPLIVADILDHFACRVEEELTTNPKESLEAAMKQAHYSFGIKGFQPLAAASKGALIKRSETVYKQEQVKLFTSVLYQPIIILSSLLFCYGYYRAAMTNSEVAMYDCNTLTFIGCIGLLGSAAFIALRFRRSGSLYEIVNQASLKRDYLLWGLMIIEFIIPEVVTIQSLLVLSVFRTVCFSYVVIRQYGVYLACKKLESLFHTRLDIA